MTPGDQCVVACAEAFRGDGAILISPMGAVPRLGALLARHTFAPDLVLTDGEATAVDLEGRPEAWVPFSRVFDLVWGGRRHVMMGASQLDRHGNQNLSCIGPHDRPRVQLLGVRGAPGNTVCHTTSYWVGAHDRRVFVPGVDMVSGVGTDRGAHELRVVVTNLCVLDFSGPGRTMAIRSLHAGVTVERVREATGFPLHAPGDVPETRGPTAAERELLERLDPGATIREALA